MLIFNLTNANLPFENANSISTYRTSLYMLLLKLTKIIIDYMQLISPLQGGTWLHVVSCTAQRQDLAILIQYMQSKSLVELFQIFSNI